MCVACDGVWTEVWVRGVMYVCACVRACVRVCACVCTCMPYM